ncbi:DNA polymerase III subunit delta' [Corynebacterium sp. TAE3-ERU12]|uniref:DNA polymerase III subunit delta' n=1 Tax=Corynebacterium sp. TAE3-ERU12 TaxID=2849491 RepID=UPI001C47E7CA|nr:DNA polymerase III subunit delta' [Corynebacterium sp. TAE3-ERU12]MBV7294498.1 DNA polymerase III subunit delta' [Corynebacterium sp. TAE3-ERU12]
MDFRSALERIPTAGGARDVLTDAVLAARVRAGDGTGITDAEHARLDNSGDSALAHAWLFTGPPGSGRTIAAENFAAALLCRGAADAERTLATVRSRSHPEFRWVMSTGATILTATVRDDLVPWLYRRPTTADWRVAVIEEADRLEEEAAQSLLKVVEEPPQRTIVIFCAPTDSARDFAVTLRSRCRHLYIPASTTSEVASLLTDDPVVQQVQPTDEQLIWAARVSNCHVGRARGLVIDDTTRQWRARALDLVENVYSPARVYLDAAELAKGAAQRATEVLKPVEEGEKDRLLNSLGVGAQGKGVRSAIPGHAAQVKALEKDNKRRRRRVELDLIDQAMIDMLTLYRDALMVSMGGATEIINIDREHTIHELARRLSSEDLVRCTDCIAAARQRLTFARPEVVLTGLIGDLQQVCRIGVQ